MTNGSKELNNIENEYIVCKGSLNLNNLMKESTRM